MLYLYLYRKNSSSVCLSVCLSVSGWNSSYLLPNRTKLWFKNFTDCVLDTWELGPFIITNFHHKRRNLQSAQLQSGPERLFCARASQIGLFRSGRKTSTPTFQLIPLFRPLSTSSFTSLCVYGSSSGYFYFFYAFYRFITFWKRVMRLKFALGRWVFPRTFSATGRLK